MGEIVQKTRILLIDNDDRHRCLLAEAFSQSGYQLASVSEPLAAMERISSETYELVILELNLPGMVGLSLLRKIKEAKEFLPVIVVSANARVGEAVEAMKLGAKDFLQKPLSKEMVRNLLLEISGRPFVEPENHKEDKHRIITNNEKMKTLLLQAREVADSQASVLIQGESGTGKELFARYIHLSGCRRDKPFVAVNCSALPETLLESELLGHEKGAFTGAMARKRGKFELADKGTILLDEISEMNIQLQAKLLRVLQEKEVDRIGGTEPIPVDVRVTSTTNLEVEALLKEGKFREDLYYRLNVIRFHLPPLRERRDDIPLLVHYFVDKYNRIEKRAVIGLTEEAMDSCLLMPWKGNVRELENTVARAVVMSRKTTLEKRDLFGDTKEIMTAPSSQPLLSVLNLKEMERKAIFQVLDRTNGNRTHAAEMLGISVRTLRNKLHEYREQMDAL